MMSYLIFWLGVASASIIAGCLAVWIVRRSAYPPVGIWLGIAGMYLAELLWVLE